MNRTKPINNFNVCALRWCCDSLVFGGLIQFDIKYARMMPIANIGGIDIWTKNLPANETAMEQTLAPNNPTMSRFIAPNGMTKVIKASAAEKRNRRSRESRVD